MNRTTKTQSTAGCFALGALALAASAGSVVSWSQPVNGSWSVSGNWTPMIVPGISDDAIIGHSGFYVVSVNGIESAASLSISNAEAYLHINTAHSLSLYGNFANEGVVVINPVSGGSLTTLHFGNDAMITGSGSIRLNGFGPRARLTSGAGGVVTNSETHTIQGFGQIEARLINDGLVRADVIGSELSLRTNPMQNDSVFEAVGGGVLNISGITLTNGVNGEIRASGPDSEVRLTGSTILGGLILSDTGGEISVTNASTLDGVETRADILVRNSHVLNIRNSVFNDGEIVLNPLSGDSETSMVFLDSSSLEGEGAVTLNGFGVRASLKSAGDHVVTNSSAHTIRGEGQIEASLTNRGLVSANVVGGELALIGGQKINVGRMEAVNGGILNILGTTVTQSDIVLDGDGRGLPSPSIVAVGTDSTIQLAGSEIINGSLETYDNASVVITCVTVLDHVAFSGQLSILNSHRLILRGETTNDGVIQVNPSGGEGVTFVEWGEKEMSLGGEGVIRLMGSGARSQLIASEGVAAGALGAGQRLEGVGQIALELVNSGEIAPGLSVGMMTATKPVVLTDLSVFEVEISPANSDLLRSITTIGLGGELEVLFVDGFAPDGFWARAAMEGTSITGAFDTSGFPTPPAGLVSRVYNSGTELIIGQTCLADFNIDGALSFFDASLFLDAFQSQDPIADLNGDGSFNFFDVSVFMVSFRNGCQGDPTL